MQTTWTTTTSDSIPHVVEITTDLSFEHGPDSLDGLEPILIESIVASLELTGEEADTVEIVSITQVNRRLQSMRRLTWGSSSRWVVIFRFSAASAATAEHAVISSMSTIVSPTFKMTFESVMAGLGFDDVVLSDVEIGATMETTETTSTDTIKAVVASGDDQIPTIVIAILVSLVLLCVCCCVVATAVAILRRRRRSNKLHQPFHSDLATSICVGEVPSRNQVTNSASSRSANHMPTRAEKEMADPMQPDDDMYLDIGDSLKNDLPASPLLGATHTWATRTSEACERNKAQDPDASPAVVPSSKSSGRGVFSGKKESQSRSPQSSAPVSPSRAWTTSPASACGMQLLPSSPPESPEPRQRFGHDAELKASATSVRSHSREVEPAPIAPEPVQMSNDVDDTVLALGEAILDEAEAQIVLPEETSAQLPEEEDSETAHTRDTEF